MIDLIFLYFFMIASLACMLMSVHLAFKFRKTKQFTSWLIISSSFLFDFLANIIYLVKFYIFNDLDSIPYPGVQDYLWILSYLVFGLGVMMYSYLVKRMIDKKKAIRDVYLISAGTLASIALSYPLLSSLNAISDLIIDPMYFYVPFFASIACIPIYYLFKGGNLSAAWRDFAIGGFLYMIGEVMFLIKELTYNYSLADVSYSLAYLFFISAFFKLFKEKS